MVCERKVKCYSDEVGLYNTYFTLYSECQRFPGYYPTLAKLLEFIIPDLTTHPTQPQPQLG